jgi:hypothetical protein
MRSFRIVPTTTLVLVLAGCGGGTGEPRPTPRPSSPSAASASAAEYRPVIDPKAFTDRITSPYFPLLPGTTWAYDGTNDDGTPQHVDVTVTRQNRTVMGVRCVVVLDVVTSDGALVEKTTDWYAQDRTGNVWYFGEDSKEYANGVVTSTAGSWEAGVGGAQPGIIMPGTPRVGQEYRQEYRPGVAEDRAKVLRRDATIRVPFGTFRDAVLTLDTNPLERGAAEHKWYAAGVGMVAADHLGSANQEVVKLTRTTRR